MSPRKCDIKLNQNPLDIKTHNGIDGDDPIKIAAKWNAFIEYLERVPFIKNYTKPLDGYTAITLEGKIINTTTLFNQLLYEAFRTWNESEEAKIYGFFEIVLNDIGKTIGSGDINTTAIEIPDLTSVQEFNNKTDPRVIIYTPEKIIKVNDPTKTAFENLSIRRATLDKLITTQILCLKYPVPIIYPFYKEIAQPPPPISYQGYFERYKINPAEYVGENYRVWIEGQQQQIVNKEQFEELKKQFLLKDLDKENFFDRVKQTPSALRENAITSLKNDSYGEWVSIMKEWGVINPDGTYNYSVFSESKDTELIYYYPEGTLPIVQAIAKQNGETVKEYKPFPPETVIPIVWGNKRFIITQNDFANNLGGISELDPSSEYGSLSKNWWKPAGFFKSYDLEIDLYKDKLPWITLNKEYLTTFSPFPEWIDAGRASFIPKIDPTKINDLTRDYYDDAVSRLSEETKLSKSILSPTRPEPSVDTSILDESLGRLDVPLDGLSPE